MPDHSRPSQEELSRGGKEHEQLSAFKRPSPCTIDSLMLERDDARRLRDEHMAEIKRGQRIIDELKRTVEEYNKSLTLCESEIRQLTGEVDALRKWRESVNLSITTGLMLWAGTIGPKITASDFVTQLKVDMRRVEKGYQDAIRGRVTCIECGRADIHTPSCSFNNDEKRATSGVVAEEEAGAPTEARELFEAWAMRQRLNIYRCGEDYVDPTTRLAWQAYRVPLT